MMKAMELQLLRVFQRHVADQCRFALSGVEVLDLGLSSESQDFVWIGCQQFLVGAANVSKALWGQRERFALAREPLRKSLQVGDDSALRNMSFRNHFEHYDERIDRWWTTSSGRNILDRMVGSPEMIAGLEDQDRFRVYDPETHRIIFWGEEFFVEPIVRELQRLSPIAESEARKPAWLGSRFARG
jgi:hypothetical protein